MMNLDVISDISQQEFVQEYIVPGKPVVVRGIPFDEQAFIPTNLKNRIGELTAQVYGSLFDLEDIASLSDYIDTYFGSTEVRPQDIPYVRWYNQLKDVDFVWGDEAFNLLSDAWKKPNCMPDRELLVPLTNQNSYADPVVDPFPYRAIQVAARGARTRLHRDPFCSEAVVSQFFGVKEAILYRPERANELRDTSDDTSFGGFIDVRETGSDQLLATPDYTGTLEAGDMIFIPQGWLHDVMVVQDSVSVTWNFVHSHHSDGFAQYLEQSPETDSEFEVLQYFLSKSGLSDLSVSGIQARLGHKPAIIQN